MGRTRSTTNLQTEEQVRQELDVFLRTWDVCRVWDPQVPCHARGLTGPSTGHAHSCDPLQRKDTKQTQHREEARGVKPAGNRAPASRVLSQRRRTGTLKAPALSCDSRCDASIGKARGRLSVQGFYWGLGRSSVPDLQWGAGDLPAPTCAQGSPGAHSGNGGNPPNIHVPRSQPRAHPQARLSV